MATRCSSSDKFGHPLAGVAVDPARGRGLGSPGVLARVPSRRLVGDYLAIVTLFFGQIFYVIVTQGYRVSLLGLNKDLGLDRANWDLTGGPNGIANVDRFRAFGFTASSERAYFYVTLTAVVVVFAALSLVNRSRTGRAWRALHDDSLAAAGDEHADQQAQGHGGGPRRRRRCTGRNDQRGSAPGCLPRRLQHPGPDHHLRDGDPRRRRESCRGRSRCVRRGGPHAGRPSSADSDQRLDFQRALGVLRRDSADPLRVDPAVETTRGDPRRRRRVRRRRAFDRRRHDDAGNRRSPEPRARGLRRRRPARMADPELARVARRHV